MEPTEKRVIVAIVLSVIILIGWQFLFFKWFKPDPKIPAPIQEMIQSEKPKQDKQSQEKQSNDKQTTANVPEVKEIRESEVVLENELWKATFSTYGAAIKSWRIKKYNIEMITQAVPGLYPLSLQLTDPQFEEAQRAEYEVQKNESNQLVFLYEGSGIKIERQYELDSTRYAFSHTTKVWLKNKSYKGDFLIGISEGQLSGPKGNILTAPYADVRNYIFHSLNKTTRKPLSSISSEDEVKTVMSWAGIENRYFISSLVNTSELKPYLVLSAPRPGTGSVFLQYPFQKDEKEKHFEISVKGYLGPKDVVLLKGVGQKLEEAVDFGIFSIICIPLLKIMNLFYRHVIGNYGLAIIFLTLLIRVLFHPLTKKSYVSMREMQRIQPQIAKLKEKFKDDRQEQQKQIMDLMRSNKVNPMGGCLPLLVQMPIFFALYRLLYNSVELYQAPFFGWIADLSAKDPYYVMPVLMGGAMFLQQKMTPSATMDPAQQKVMMFMPVIFSFFMIALPSGLVIYILFSTLLQLASQYLVNREFIQKGL